MAGQQAENVNTFLRDNQSKTEQAKDNVNTAKSNRKAAQEALKSAKREIPQDPDKVKKAQEAVSQAKADEQAAKSARQQAKDEEKKAISASKAFDQGVWSAGATAGLFDPNVKPDQFKKNLNVPNAGEFTGEDNLEEDREKTILQANVDEQNGSDNAEQGSGQMVKDSIKNNFKFSDSFYRDIGAMVRGQPGGNQADVAASTAKAQAQNQRNESANRQMEAQQAQQIANQNPYAEAGKMASVQNDAENRQRVKSAGVLGAGAALARKTNTPDVQSQMQREDTQRQVAAQRREEADKAQQGATESEGQSQSFKVMSRDADTDKDESAAVSMGEEPETQEEQTTETTDNTEETDTTDNTDNTETTEETETETETETEEETQEYNEPDTSVFDEQQEEEVTPPTAEPEQQPEPQPEPEPEPEPEKQEETPEQFNTTWQNVMNYLTYGNDKTSKWSQPGGKDGGNAQKFAESKQWQPLTESDVANTSNGFDSPTGELQEVMKNARPEFMQEWEGNSGRVGANGQINQGDEGFDEAVKTQVSDERMKHVMSCLSDLRMKMIREAYDRDGCCSPEDFMWLARHTGGSFNHNGRDYNFFSDDDWKDDNDGSVLNGYADYIRNYVYTYKPEATQIDSSIDPNEEHIGPMAQDIEMVNPACIRETPEGVKTVDTARLAMMNAGAIGDLARQLQDLSAKLKMILGE